MKEYSTLVSYLRIISFVLISVVNKSRYKKKVQRLDQKDLKIWNVIFFLSETHNLIGIKICNVNTLFFLSNLTATIIFCTQGILKNKKQYFLCSTNDILYEYTEDT